MGSVGRSRRIWWIDDGRMWTVGGRSEGISFPRVRGTLPKGNDTLGRAEQEELHVKTQAPWWLDRDGQRDLPRQERGPLCGHERIACQRAGSSLENGVHHRKHQKETLDHDILAKDHSLSIELSKHRELEELQSASNEETSWRPPTLSATRSSPSTNVSNQRLATGQY